MVSGIALMRSVFSQIPAWSQVADKSKHICAIGMENNWFCRLRSSAGNEQCLMPHGGTFPVDFATVEQASSPNLLSGVTDSVSF